MKNQNLHVKNIKRLIDPLEFFRRELSVKSLKKHGWNDAGLCPFHSDKTPGSFFVNNETGAYKCFSCGAKGDVIDFTMAFHDLGFSDALAKLSEEWGL